MLNIILNIIGLILIAFSICVIGKNTRKQKELVNDLKTIEDKLKEYHRFTEEIAGSFDDIIKYKLDTIDTKIDNTLDNKILRDKDEKSNETDEALNLSSIHTKVIELKKIGLTNEEIAKKLNKGVREIEIILKMHEIKK
jgi:hypothetical protein